MTTAPNISMKDARSAKPGELLLGEDWVSPEVVADNALREGRGRRGIVSLNRSPLARKIIVFNLMALVILVAGVLFMNPFRDSLVLQREQGLVTEAQLIANVVETAVAATAGQLPANINEMGIGPGVEVFLFDPAGVLVSRGIGAPRESNLAARDQRQTIITDFLNSIWEGVSGLLGSTNKAEVAANGEAMARDLYAKALAGETAVNTGRAAEGGAQFSVATPVMQAGAVIGAVVLTSAEGEIDRLVRYEREQILQMFVIALCWFLLVLALCWPQPLPTRCPILRLPPNWAATVMRAKCRLAGFASPIWRRGRMKSAVCRWRCGAWWRRFTTALTPTNNLRPTSHMKSRTRWRRCDQLSARCGW